MSKIAGGLMMFLVFNSLGQTDVLSQTRDRSEVPDKYKWNLSDLYESDDAWLVNKQKVADQIGEMPSFKGTLSESAAKLLACLDFNSEIRKTFDRLFSYSGNKSNQDTRDSKYIGMRQEMGQLWTQFSAETSFIEPEIVSMDEKTIQKFIKEEPGLKPYTFLLNDLMRQKKHTLSEGEEKVMAEAGRMSGAAYNIHNILTNAEFPYPEVTLSTGEAVKLDQAGYGRYRTLSNREDRKRVFEAFFGAFNKFRGTFGAQVYAKMNQDLFYTRARGYTDCLEMSLDPNNIPVEVYHNHIANVNKNLDKFHRYLNIKKRMLGVDTLYYYDLYAPTVKGVELNYEIEDAKALILESMKLLGDKYLSVVKKACNERWIDMYPTTGKRSGAYSNDGAYDAHPYILMNYKGLYDDMGTLTHELGHTMHTYFAFQNQLYPTSGYSYFVAEVASTFNEVLLKEKVLEKIKGDDTRLSLLMEYLDGVKGTLFRQTQFAEYELRIHQEVENGNALTGDSISDIYREITRKYYGHDNGICIVPDYIDAEWTYIHHFLGYTYYVYQYATSFTASTALAEKILSKEKGAVEKYLAFLSAGGSDYPIYVLKKAGVDMTTSEPFEKTIQAMERTMDDIEKILKKKGM